MSLLFLKFYMDESNHNNIYLYIYIYIYLSSQLLWSLMKLPALKIFLEERFQSKSLWFDAMAQPLVSAYCAKINL